MEYWNAKISYETELFLKNKNKVFYLNFNKEFSNIENINNIFITLLIYPENVTIYY